MRTGLPYGAWGLGCAALVAASACARRPPAAPVVPPALVSQGTSHWTFRREAGPVAVEWPAGRAELAFGRQCAVDIVGPPPPGGVALADRPRDELRPACSPVLRITFHNETSAPLTGIVNGGMPLGSVIFAVGAVPEAHMLQTHVEVAPHGSLDVVLPVQWFGIRSTAAECLPVGALMLQRAFLQADLGAGLDAALEIQAPDGSVHRTASIAVPPEAYMCPP